MPASSSPWVPSQSLSALTVVSVAPLPPLQPAPFPTANPGYWLVASDGGIFTFGDAAYDGSTGARPSEPTHRGHGGHSRRKGYWLVAADGGIFTFGDARFFGSTGAVRLNQPIVGMAATPTGTAIGWWPPMVAFSPSVTPLLRLYRDLHLNAPVVGMAATPDGHGYWLVAADGGIFTFGDAGYFGSTGAMRLNQPIVGMAATPDGQGYWLVAADGGIFTFGDAGYFGSAPSSNPLGHVVGISPTSNGQGYWIAANNGAVDSFGNAAPGGSSAGLSLNEPIVGVAAVPPAPTVLTAPVPLSVTTTPLAIARQGAPYPPRPWPPRVALPPTPGFPSERSLPASVSPRVASSSGTPSSPGTSTFTVQVTDSTAPTPLTATATIALTVAPPPLSITTTTLPDAVAGTPYSAALTAAGGASPYTWAVTNGALPAGLTLTSGGTITGTPSGQGNSSFTVQVVDASPTPLASSVTLSIVLFPATSSVSHDQSGNWSGYIELDGPFTSVTGTFSVPSLLPHIATSDLMAEWVGIDGGTGGVSLIQAGFNETPDPNDPNNPAGFVIQPWWEILPAAETYISSVTIRPGIR